LEAIRDARFAVELRGTIARIAAVMVSVPMVRRSSRDELPLKGAARICLDWKPAY